MRWQTKDKPRKAAGGTGRGGRTRAPQIANAAGAQVNARYLDREQPTVGVAMEDLKDFRDSAVEEFGQFSFGGFFVSGAFWMIIERAFTVANFWADSLFWVCVLALISGAIISAFGLRQLIRRQRRINRIIVDAEAKIKSELH